MSTLPTMPALLADLARRGFTVRVAGGALAVSPASALTAEDRNALHVHRADLLATLSPAEPWDANTAARLMSNADALVERLGVDGRHPAVKDAAAMVASAFATHDLETLQFAVSEFVILIRQLARKPGNASGTNQTTADTSANVSTLSQQVQQPKSDGT